MFPNIKIKQSMYTSRYTLLPQLDNASGPYIPLCNKLDLAVASRGFTMHFGKLRTLKKKI